MCVGGGGGVDRRQDGWRVLDTGGKMELDKARVDQVTAHGDSSQDGDISTALTLVVNPKPAALPS